MTRIINDGKEFESIVASVHKLFAKDAKVTENEHIVGKSGRERQIDVAIRTTIMGYGIFILVECKDYKSKIGIGKVDELIGKIEDVGADKGILVSNSGFTKDAVDRARKDNRIQLSSVIDLGNNKLRAKLAIPFLAHIDEPVSLQLTITGTGDLPPVSWELLSDEKRKFRKLWNQGKLDTSPGEHKYDDVLIDKDKSKLTVTMAYTTQRKSYFKKVLLENSTGIFNHLSGGYTTKQITTEVIRLDDFSKWEEVNGELPKVTMGIFGQVSFPDETDVEDNFS